MNPDNMTVQQHSKWCDMWEQYAAEMTAIRTLAADVAGGFIATLAEIRALPEMDR